MVLLIVILLIVGETVTASAKNHREKLLDAAQSHILARGFPAARVDEICKAAGVTKGSFYHHFASKDALAAALVDHYFSRVTEALCGGAWSQESEPALRLAGFLDHARGVFEGPLLREGCLLGSFALDLSETHPEIRAEIARRFDVLVAFLAPIIQAAIDLRAEPGPSSAEALARHFVSVLQGSIVLAKAYNDHRKLAEGLDSYRVMLEALVLTSSAETP